ncbi:sugar ABC transporter permease [Paenibacillus sp. F411]|uniref:Binding-protein-dependent transporters inner membrane component n=2 Tax=Paenibacillus TaxID=44249 RepID=A0A4P8XJL6_9BACL|nr:sugar ABC transporter permease [Paenibacillus sp. F411]QCT01561.1 binding-protein-dependent transporters inner membrane component [Paenibacillus algicola]
MESVKSNPQAAPKPSVSKVRKSKKPREKLGRTWPLHLMLLPAALVTLIFAYVPMGGLIMAFQDFKPYDGVFNSPFVGLEHFRFMFEYPDSKQVIINTLIIAGLKIVFGLLVPFTFAILLNEIRLTLFKRVVQTLVYLPHFISWVILGAILTDMLGSEGIVNGMLQAMGMDPIFWLGDGNWFRFTVVVSDIWQNFGFNTIVFLAALAGVNPSLYEAAEVDGANRWKQTLYITIPAMIPITVVVATLSIGNILNAGFDQIFNLYNPLVYDKGDIIDTFVYRTAILNGQFSFGTAVGMFKSVVGLVLIVISYRLAARYAGYKIF